MKQSVAQGKYPVSSGMISSKSSLNLAATSLSAKDQSGVESSMPKDIPSKGSHDMPRGANEKRKNQITLGTSTGSPPAKAQVVGWPPIRSFRKNSLSIALKNNEEVDGKPVPSVLFVKVSMDGAPYLRKVDLRTYTAYQDLSSALEKMFICFTIGQCGSHGAPGREVMSESKLRDRLHGSEYVLTYEDKDGDWMLVGDIPWEDRIRSLNIISGYPAQVFFLKCSNIS
ncbi:Auxin-responsive protein iaa8 [Ranunculus cassubicifolius]